MEIKRSINNRNFLFCIATVVLSFVLGYILLISIDRIKYITIKQLFFSVYTVFTQFGMMIFPIVVINSINSDYREKNILFYRVLNIESKQYFLRKLGVMFFWFSCALVAITFVVCIIYADFSMFGIMLIYFENAIIYIILISSLLAFVFKNMLVSFCINLFIWISSIVLFTAFPNHHYIAYFDASNKVYLNLEKYLKTSNIGYLAIGQSCLYNLVLFFVIFGLVCAFSKQWLKNGI